MSNDKNQITEPQQQNTSVPQKDQQQHRSGAFNEPKPEEQKSTINNEEADLEQERKEAMTERD